MKLVIKNASNISLTHYPGDPSDTQVLIVSFMLTPPLAEKLRCREQCYNDSGVPRAFEGDIGLVIRVEDADVQLGELTLPAALIHKFKVGRPRTQAESDVTLHVKVRLHFDGDCRISDWFKEVNKSEYTFSINSAQSEFDFSAEEEGLSPSETEAEGEPEPAGPTLASARTAAGGTPHTGPKKQRRRGGQEAAANDQPEEFSGNCVDCSNSIPYVEGSTTIHASGQACTRRETTVN